ncbi:hypothetical protein [Streptomyces thermolilacinus]|uniref:hypothetical protein n=1 Tax=Streptomyces thermolilacinus TaxID=285540 RepID=UPI001112D247|nr:hypothetical protein [Streptomyces thermolilacinus]
MSRQGRARRRKDPVKGADAGAASGFSRRAPIPFTPLGAAMADVAFVVAALAVLALVAAITRAITRL